MACRCLAECQSASIDSLPSLGRLTHFSGLSSACDVLKSRAEGGQWQGSSTMCGDWSDRAAPERRASTYVAGFWKPSGMEFCVRDPQSLAP